MSVLLLPVILYAISCKLSLLVPNREKGWLSLELYATILGGGLGRYSAGSCIYTSYYGQSHLNQQENTLNVE